MKLESSDSDLRLGRNPYFKISKHLNQIWAKNKEQNDLNHEINYLNLI